MAWDSSCLLLSRSTTSPMFACRPGEAFPPPTYIMCTGLCLGVAKTKPVYGPISRVVSILVFSHPRPVLSVQLQTPERQWAWWWLCRHDQLLWGPKAVGYSGHCGNHSHSAGWVFLLLFVCSFLNSRTTFGNKPKQQQQKNAARNHAENQTPHPSILGTCIRTRTNRLTSARIPIVAWFAWSTCILVADVFYSFYWFYWSGFSLMRLAALFSFFNILPSPLPNGPSHRQLSEPCYRICSFFLLCGANLTWWYKDGLLSRQKIRGAPQPHMRHRAFSFLVSFFSLFGSCALF